MLETSVASLLCARTGIDFRTTSPRVLARIIRTRMEAVGVEDETAYLTLLTTREQEVKHLIDSLVVPETWFFRDFEPFVYLRKIVCEDDYFLGNRPIRALSVPASTGEEPYSIAITLMEAGLKPADLRVDAVDISRKAIDKAVQGVYGRSSFREKDEELRLKYFSQSESGWSVLPEVRSAVHFFHGNILHCAPLDIQQSYDIIFFRNLLVYLNEEARKRAVENVDHLLMGGGVLFLGFAEPPHIFFPNYIPADHPRSYAARKPKESPARNETAPMDRLPLRSEKQGVLKPLPRSIAKKTGSRGGRPKSAGPPPHEPTSGLPSMESAGRSGATPEIRAKTLDRARELADRGLLSEAGDICTEYLKSDAACEEAYYLLGVIALAGNDEEQALGYFNKAIYLKPDHEDVLVHLSLLMEKRGFGEQAAGYRKRLERLRGGPPA